MTKKDSFFCAAKHGYRRVMACSPDISLGDPKANAAHIISLVKRAHEGHVDLVLFPELCLCGYSIEDLLLDVTLLDDVSKALLDLRHISASYAPVFVVGAPLRVGDHLFNCAVVIHQGAFLGIVPKSYLPNYGEFQERRYFTPASGRDRAMVRFGDDKVPFGEDLLFKDRATGGMTFGVELCEDLWMPIPPSSGQALAGAELLLNLSASPFGVGKSQQRLEYGRVQSARCLSAYLFAGAGAGESTTDLCWDGEVYCCENGAVLTYAKTLDVRAHYVMADIDLQLLRQARMRRSTFKEAASNQLGDYRIIPFEAKKYGKGEDRLLHPIPAFPFLAGASRSWYEEICAMQSASLRQRMKASGAHGLILGISGGLDSAHALLIAVMTVRSMKLPVEAVRAYTMPGFATSKEGLSLAWQLMKGVGCRCEEIDIKPICAQLLTAISHPHRAGRPCFDTTFENVQAGVRTDILFRLANQHQALVVGTGDLSELVMGWCTYGVGDHMAHYSLNTGLPKTVISALCYGHIAYGAFSKAVADTLEAIRARVISPELVPSDEKGVQDTQEMIGPYPLVDFVLYWVLAYGLSPSKIAYMAYHAFETDKMEGAWILPQDKRSYGIGEIKKWLGVFFKRFLQLSQFKRSALPNGPKIFANVAISPRGDLRLPSDGNAKIWLRELDKYVPDSD